LRWLHTSWTRPATQGGCGQIAAEAGAPVEFRKTDQELFLTTSDGSGAFQTSFKNGKPYWMCCEEELDFSPPVCDAPF